MELVSQNSKSMSPPPMPYEGVPPQSAASAPNLLPQPMPYQSVPAMSSQPIPYQGVPVMPQLQQPLVYPDQIASVGVSLSDAKKINFQYCMNQLELDKKASEYNMALQFEAERQRIRGSQIQSQANYDVKIDGESAVNRKSINMKDLVQKFIDDNSIVKIRDRGVKKGIIFYIRNNELNRHEPIEEKNLHYLLDEFIFNSFELEEDVPRKFLDRAWSHLQFSVKTLDNSKIIKLSCYQTVFLDGIYNLETDEFELFSNEKFFNDFSIPMYWNEVNSEPIVFENLLHDMFGHDIRKIITTYQFIGALLSSVQILKKIYIFQGVSQGGKTRLARIICSLFDENDVIFLDKLSDITQDYVEKNLSNCRLIYIDEAANKKILPTQASMLKTIANGCRRAKILIGTNHALVTGDNGFVEPALLNRFAPLSFGKVMDNSDPDVAAFEDVYLEKEKPAIIKKSLRFFQKIVSSGSKHFTYEFPVNEVVSTNDNATPDSMANEQLRDFLYETYEITEEPVPETTTEVIFQEINQKFPGVIKNNATLGKKLSEIYGDRLKTQHLSKGMIYNLKKKLST